jgi:hypothetical protein
MRCSQGLDSEWERVRVKSLLDDIDTLLEVECSDSMIELDGTHLNGTCSWCSIRSFPKGSV